MSIKNFNSDGFITVKSISTIPVEARPIIGKGEKNCRTYKPMTPKGITVHNTGNTSPSAGASSHANYMQNIENDDSRWASWHFTVDDVKIVQHIPVNEQGYHAGDGSGAGNSTTISIEICENRNYAKAEKNAIALIKFLCQTFSFSSDVIFPHRYFAKNKKLCPIKILKSEQNWQNNWDKWIADNFKDMDKSSTAPVGNWHTWSESSIDKALAYGVVAGVKEEINWQEPISLERLCVFLDRLGLLDKKNNQG